MSQVKRALLSAHSIEGRIAYIREHA